MVRRAKGSVTWFHLILLARLVDAIPRLASAVIIATIDSCTATSRVGTRESTFFLPLYQPQRAAQKRYGKPIGHLTEDYKRRCPLRGTSQTSLGLPQSPLKMCIILPVVHRRPLVVSMDVTLLEDFAFFSLTKIVLYASHFVFNPQLNAYFTILSFCGSRIAKCLLPRKTSMWDQNALPMPYYLRLVPTAW